jgi:hypothetical protein
VVFGALVGRMEDRKGRWPSVMTLGLVYRSISTCQEQPRPRAERNERGTKVSLTAREASPNARSFLSSHKARLRTHKSTRRVIDRLWLSTLSGSLLGGLLLLLTVNLDGGVGDVAEELGHRLAAVCTRDESGERGERGGPTGCGGER